MAKPNTRSICSLTFCNKFSAFHTISHFSLVSPHCAQWSWRTHVTLCLHFLSAHPTLRTYFNDVTIWINNTEGWRRKLVSKSGFWTQQRASNNYFVAKQSVRALNRKYELHFASEFYYSCFRSSSGSQASNWIILCYHLSEPEKYRINLSTFNKKMTVCHQTPNQPHKQLKQQTEKYDFKN